MKLMRWFVSVGVLTTCMATSGATFFTSTSEYVVPVNPSVKVNAILTVGDSVGGYRMVGIPDGLGAFDNGNGTFTLLMNHELENNVGTVRAHGGRGAFVSKWIIDKSTLEVLSGQDLIHTVVLSSGTINF